jgi:hypothetical protein
VHGVRAFVILARCGLVVSAPPIGFSGALISSTGAPDSIEPRGLICPPCLLGMIMVMIIVGM